jgi:hypothetical protein
LRCRDIGDLFGWTGLREPEAIETSFEKDICSQRLAQEERQPESQKGSPTAVQIPEQQAMSRMRVD